MEMPFHFPGFGCFLQLLLFKLFLGGGFGEEFGWRGFMLSEMNKKSSYLYSTLVIGVVWALWHLPAYFLSSKGQEDPLLPFFISVIAFSFYVHLVLYKLPEECIDCSDSTRLI